MNCCDHHQKPGVKRHSRKIAVYTTIEDGGGSQRTGTNSITRRVFLFRFFVLHCYTRKTDWLVCNHFNCIPFFYPSPLFFFLLYLPWSQRDLSHPSREPSALRWWIQPAERRCSPFFFFALRFVLQQLTSIRHLITKHFFFVLIFRSYNLDVTTHPFFLSKWTWWNALQCYYCTMSNFGFKKKGGNMRSTWRLFSLLLAVIWMRSGDHYRCNYTRGGLRGANGMQCCRCSIRWLIHWRMNYLFSSIFLLPPHWKVSRTNGICSGSCLDFFLFTDRWNPFIGQIEPGHEPLIRKELPFFVFLFFLLGGSSF